MTCTSSVVVHRSTDECVCVCVTGLMASAGGDSGGVDSKAELSALLEQWEREQQAGSSELLNILTK